MASGHGSVHHTRQPFSAVWHDLGIEQSINRDYGKYRDLYSRQDTLNRYLQTAHHKACFANSMRIMSGLQSGDEDNANISKHKEAAESRINADNKCISDIMDVMSDRMVNPFKVEKRASPDNKQPLMNIATSTVATETVTQFAPCEKNRRS